MSMIEENTRRILESLPKNVELVVAAKARSADEIGAAIKGGARIIGENYVQEARRKFEAIGRTVSWHCIGHLQKNKVRAAVAIFDMIETLDSLDLARALNDECERANRNMPVLIEINSASEPQKHGIRCDDAEDFLAAIMGFSRLTPMGLMTMGPFVENAQELRPYFKMTRELFEKIQRSFAGRLASWNCLSMGMSSSYRIAVEEGATLVRVGTAIFGPRGTA